MGWEGGLGPWLWEEGLPLCPGLFLLKTEDSRGLCEACLSPPHSRKSGTPVCLKAAGTEQGDSDGRTPPVGGALMASRACAVQSSTPSSQEGCWHGQPASAECPPPGQLTVHNSQSRRSAHLSCRLTSSGMECE